MIKKKFLFLMTAVILLMGVVTLSGCLPEKEESNNVSKEHIKIGVLADLTGDYANFLRGIPQGAKFAAEDFKKDFNGEIDLIIEDQKSCNVKETVSIMNKFISVDKVDFIIGGTCSSTTLAAAPIANQYKTVMISAASSAPSITKEGGEYVFRTYMSDILRAKGIGKLAYDLGKKKMALITDINNDAAVEMSNGAKDEFANLGGNVVANEEISKTDIDFKTQLLKVKNVEPDVIVLSITSPNQIGLVAKQLRELGVNITILMPAETAEDKAVVEVGGDAVEGLIYAMPGNPPETELYQDLKNRNTNLYGDTEMPLYLTESYDAVTLGLKAYITGNDNSEDIKTSLFKVSKTYKGVSGNTQFDENGDVVKDVMFKTIKNGKFVEYKIGD